MHFNMCVVNHPLKSILKLEDFVRHIRGPLIDLGARFTVSYADLMQDAMNLFFEYFTDDWLPRFEKFADYGIPYGLVCTERIIGDTFNGYSTSNPGGWLITSEQDPEGKGLNWVGRYRNFIAIARSASFVWCIYRDSVEPLRKTLGHDRVFYLPLGYCAELKDSSRAQSDVKDFDLSFIGKVTPYRSEIMERCRAAGLKVFHHDGFLPDYVRSSITARSRISLSLRMSEGWSVPSPSRIAYLLANGACVVAERMDCPLETDAYVELVVKDELIDRCQNLLQSGEWQARGERGAERFRTDLDMGTVMKKLLAETFPDEAPVPS